MTQPTVNLLAKKSNFVSREVQAAQDFISALNRWRALEREWVNQDYTNSITQEDLIGDNAHLTPEILEAAFTTMNDIATRLDQNNRIAPLYRLIP